MKIYSYQKCTCGAITLHTDEGEYSCKMKNLRKFFPGIDLRRLPRYNVMFCCNHCINHYGLDLCGCGSGEEFGKCGNGLEECEIPAQVLGGYTRVNGKDSLLAS